MQTPHIPDSISYGELDSLLQEATPDLAGGGYMPLSEYEAQIIAQADKVLDFSMEIPNIDPMVHKIMVLKLLVGFGNYLHGLAQRQEDSSEAQRLLMAVGRIHSAHELIQETPLHQSDFTSFDLEDEGESEGV